MRVDRAQLTTILPALTAALLVGCIEAQPPVLPVPATLSVDLSSLVLAPVAAQYPEEEGTEFSNFSEAVDYFRWVRLNGAAVVAVPLSAVSALYGTEPAHAGEAWTYTGNAHGLDLIMYAYGSPSEGYDLELYVTRLDLGLNGFRWMEGSSSADLLSGVWLLRNPNFTASDNSVMQIAWSVSAEDVRSTTFTNLQDGHADEGDTLTYDQDGDDVTVTYVDASDGGVQTLITWDRTTASGSIQAPGYKAGEVACWGETYEDADCAEVLVEDEEGEEDEEGTETEQSEGASQ